MTLLLSSMWRYIWQFPSIWLNFKWHRALQWRHQSHTAKSAKTFLTVYQATNLAGYTRPHRRNGLLSLQILGLLGTTGDWKRSTRSVVVIRCIQCPPPHPPPPLFTSYHCPGVKWISIRYARQSVKIPTSSGTYSTSSLDYQQANPVNSECAPSHPAPAIVA